VLLFGKLLDVVIQPLRVSPYFLLVRYSSRCLLRRGTKSSAGTGRGLRTGLIGFRAAHVVLLDSVSGPGASGDGSRELDGGGDGAENSNDGRCLMAQEGTSIKGAQCWIQYPHRVL